MSKKTKKRPQPIKKISASASEPNEKWIIVGCIAIYILIVIWGLLSKGTWDDDCPTRYYNVRHALKDPYQFVTLWNRPLFTLLYVLPLQLGSISVIFETALIAVLTGYVMYQAAKDLKLPNAYMVIPFTVFQAFYFPVAFNALTEPLAALLLALGVLFHIRKQYWAFALCGALLPLARLELSVLLLFWVAILIRQQHWKYVPILAIPALLWNFTGTFFDGNLFWLSNKVFTGKENIYGHGSFWQYFHRYIYLTGPVIFYFFILGLSERLYRRKFDFSLLLFVVGFMVYVVLSWKLSIGQAAGFMRNLLPLSPLAALLALEGYNHWVCQESDKQINIHVLVHSSIVVALTILFFSRKLVIHHIVGPEPEYVKLSIILFLVFIFILKNYIFGFEYSELSVKFLISGLVIGLTMAYTLITEPPIGLTQERALMQRVAEWYGKNNLSQTKTFVNHIWFFYAKDYDYYSDQFDRVKKVNLEKAPKSSIVIWESHYSHRLFGDVKLDYFNDNPNFKELGRMVTPNRRFAVVILQKL